jgi:hypothetical protein
MATAAKNAGAKAPATESPASAPAKKAAPAAKLDKKALATYVAREPIKTLDGMVQPGEEIELNGADAAELKALGAIETGDDDDGESQD